MNAARLIDIVDLVRNFELVDKLILPKFGKDALKNPSLTDFEHRIFRRTYSIEDKTKIEKIQFPSGTIWSNDFNDFAINYIGILTKMAKFFNIKDFRCALYKLFKNAQVPKQYEHIRRCILATYEKSEEERKEDANVNRMFECGMTIGRKLFKMMRTIHRKKSKFFRKLMIEDLRNLYEGRKDMVPEEIAEHWYFKRYVERLK